MDPSWAMDCLFLLGIMITYGSSFEPIPLRIWIQNQGWYNLSPYAGQTYPYLELFDAFGMIF